jgi:hypothetical protein
MTLEEFAKLVRNHDLTFQFSDDHRCWRSGWDRYQDILEAAKQFPREDVVRIWNAEVDRKIVESARNWFYWKE